MDSDHNQLLTQTLGILDGSKRQIYQFVDYNKNYFTIQIPEINYCIQKEFPADIKISLKQLMLDMRDPSKGLTVYKGVSEVDFAPGTYHVFQMTSANNPLSKYHVV